MGLRLKENDILYVADAFWGILKVNLKTGIKFYFIFLQIFKGFIRKFNTGEKKTVLSPFDRRFGDLKPKFTNDLDLYGDEIYFIDSSYQRDVNDVFEVILEGLPSGRLFLYNEKTDKLELLKDGLFFPNGMQLGPNKDYVLINENTKCRIIK